MYNNNDALTINAIRALSIDAIEKANSGHPGLPLGAAPFAYVLWAKNMMHNPKNPTWFNRDRFVLSAGHGSALLYSMLHMAGYGLPMDELKNFRQWGSKTPGHPEYGHTVGVEATTGPLGQGIGMAVGMAMAESHLAAKYNRDGYDVVNHYTYALCGDGDLMEGVSHEASSLAAHLKLGRLILLYDSNDISLDGDLHKSFSESVKERYEAYGWHYLRVDDANNLEAVDEAIKEAKKVVDKPTIIEIKSIIGMGAPNQGTSKVHGAPLGKEGVKITKEFFQYNHEDFTVPQEAYDTFQGHIEEYGVAGNKVWDELFEGYKNAYPELAKELEDAISGKLPEDFTKDLPSYAAGKGVATRNASGEAINYFAKKLPSLFGGSADLAGSNKTTISGAGDFSAENRSGRNIWFGVREFAMGTMMNGMHLHGGLRVFGGTFFVFSDYVRPAVRLSALMGLPVVYVFTHDSVAVGEDGPTHEPIEHLPSFRAMPNLTVLRPADGNETYAAWKVALESESTPTILALSRQNLTTMPLPMEEVVEGVKRGAYIASPSEKEVSDVLLIATGSEVPLAYEAQQELKKEGIDAAVVSMPSWDLFEKQDKAYKEKVLNPSVKKRLAMELSNPLGWERYVGDEGKILGIDTFGASAPGELVMEKFGFNVPNVVSMVKDLLK
ncbi:transketolase [Proteiniclasticum ruminis]|uniref:Transketolase n=1 Tax=Proteiniclasticum ruminis TaxID=398199 RepID=A0A1I5DX03_9CLOT|nr:transketolase [Proteiniclasticum ruminis]SFO03697.1 transketolase [Proteiniclasticum ruminis]